MPGKYDDIIDLPHHTSENRQHITMEMRAAQFSPFAALTGLDDELAETARLTSAFHELSEDEKQELDRKLQELRDSLTKLPECSFLYFVPDERKSGGSYERKRGRVKSIDDYSKEIVLENGERLAIEMLSDIEII
ncbi:MAG: hypothetical protein J6Z46_00960 [Lachnospiraceae bacterium]|nr:hypothetical protein [Lachnospiraceae bacterium]